MVQIELRDTLTDFLRDEAKRTPSRLLPKAYIAHNPVSDPDLAISLPCNTKYMLPEWHISNVPASFPIGSLILMPQRMSWITGKMPVIFPEVRGKAGKTWKSQEEDYMRNISILNPACQPEPHFCESLERIALASKGGSVIPYLPSDALVQLLPHHTDPELWYELLTKRSLALSGLPTPSGQIVDFDDLEPGDVGASLDIAVARAVSTIQARALPFVLKTNYSSGGKGTFLVTTSEEHQEILQQVQEFLRRELRKVNQENSHLHPCSLVLTHLLPGVAKCVNFYVGYDGQARFSSVCEQHFSDKNIWQGAAITYSLQSQYATSYAEIIQKSATFLHTRGHHGPVGIDVMTDDSGEHYVVDLNPRPTASFVLGCLRSHFVDNLSFDAACILPTLIFPASRASFMAAFEKELRIGEMVILAWYSNAPDSNSYAGLAVGGRDDHTMQELCDRVHKWIRDSKS